ncbi:hypothetical protein KI387_003427, partial [Taxus chinensis]
ASAWRPRVSCDDPANLSPDMSHLWVIDKPNIPCPPKGWERLLTLRGEGACRFADVYYISPCGKRLRSMVEVERFLEENTRYGATISDFNFQIPRPLHDSKRSALEAQIQGDTGRSSRSKKMGRNCGMGILMALLICFCFTIVDVNGGSGYHDKWQLKEKVTHLEFYMHDIVLGKNATAVQVAPQKPVNISAEASYFGPVYVIDDPLTETPHPKSRVLGRAQGLYAMSSQGEISLLMALTYSIDSGKYKGSSLSVVGKNMVLRDQREFPIVGGSGHFRMARGYAFAHTISLKGPDAVIGYNVTVFHYGP